MRSSSRDWLPSQPRPLMSDVRYSQHFVWRMFVVGQGTSYASVDGQCMDLSRRARSCTA